MTEVHKALRELDINWKKTGAYNLKCRWVAPGQSSNDRALSNHGSSDSLMGGSMPRVSSSGRWSAEQHGVSGTVTAGTKDNESGVESNVLKFEVQLFKLREEKYMLDLQRLEGPTYLFADLCSAFLAELRVV
jgi:5'-AMP-activated protein kinase catalytic alpha subunit